uniref:LAGLIDADG endonuclease n=1 Tax=Pisolithus microcarpus TaxID=178872 RepID=A0A873QIF8_9AGAM|nr:LAGLIDADG endonuclease [Pisolithus microcarpus]QPA36155.1 LAGLIDADG endonuclease [Pisolithus microcarpus]
MPYFAPNIYFLNDNNFIYKECLVKLFQFFKLYNLSYFDTFVLINNTTSIISCENLFNKNKISSNKRIGPHNITILSILFGSLLGDCHAEFRNKGTRFCFYQEASHTSYLMWLHSLISDLGYTSSKEPKIHTRLGKKGRVRKVIRFKTWTYSSFNWIYEIWYNNNTKVVPSNIGEYLTPLALAIWIMDDGSKTMDGLKLSTNSFSYSECILLVRVLYENFNLKTSIQSAGVENQYVIYIWKESMPLLNEIILSYVHSSMKYKLNKK